MPDFNNMLELNLGLLFFSALVTVFLLIGILLDSKQRRPYMKSFVVLLVVNIMMHLGEAGIWIIDAAGGNDSLIRICCFLSFGGGPALISAYSYCLFGFIRETKKVSCRPVQILAVVSGIYLIMLYISMMNGMIYSVDSQGKYIDGPLVVVAWLFDACLLVEEIILALYYRKYINRKERFFLLSFVFLAFPTTLLQKIWYPVPEMLASTLSIILIFVLFYKEMTRQLMKTEKQLVESRVSIAVSQIQPHFVYNTLSSIGELCQIDPSMAEEVTTRFAQYLRVNLEHMEDTLPVPFAKELQHVKTYLWIEKIRFGEDLDIVYDIQTQDFRIPSLTVQPLVENAVKHGMMGSEDVCTITIATRKREGGYEIIIQDNGNGFNIEEYEKNGRKHVGIENVRKRVELMVNGTVTIDSRLGEGTRVCICVPKEMGMRAHKQTE